MDVYGLTGGIGSGKTTVAELLEEYGVPVVSADELSRIVVARGSEGLADVVRTFGPEVLDDQAELDRRKMAAIVFQDQGKRRQLEAILHPRIRERFEQVLDALEKAGHEVAVYEVPLLFEKNLQGEMQAVILVTADQSVRTRRVQARDDVTETEVRARMAAQMDETLKRKRADYIIENNGTMDDLRREVEFLLDRFMRVGARRAAASMGDQSSTRMSIDEVEQEDGGTPSRMRTEIPSGAGLPVDGQPPMFGQWQTRTVTAPSEPVPAAPSTVTMPGTPPVPPYEEPTDPAAEALRPPIHPPSPGDAPIESPATRRSKTMPAIPIPALEQQSPFSAPVPPPGPSLRSGTPPAPAPPLHAPPGLGASLQPTMPGPIDPTPSPSSTARTEGVPTEPTHPSPSGPEGELELEIELAVPEDVPEERTPPSGNEEEEQGSARAGNPAAAGRENENGLGTGARRRKTMPASHFVDLRPAPPSPLAPTVPNVPPPPTPDARAAGASSDSGASPPPPPPPPSKRSE